MRKAESNKHLQENSTKIVDFKVSESNLEVNGSIPYPPEV